MLPSETLPNGLDNNQQVLQGEELAHVTAFARTGNPTADGTLELRTDAKIVRYPDRYNDKRGEEMWTRGMKLLAEYQRQQAQAARAV